MKKLLSWLLAGLLLLGLTACGGELEQPEDKIDDGVTVELAVDEESEHGDIVQIPHFVYEGENPVLAAMNERLAAKVDAYYAALGMAEDTYWYEYVPYVVETEDFISIVLYEGEWPNYGTDGNAGAYVWDRRNNVEMDAAMAWEYSGATHDDVLAALNDYAAVRSNDDIRFYCEGYGVEAWYVDTDGEIVLVLGAVINPEPMENADPWKHLVCYKGGEVFDFAPVRETAE